MGTYHDWHSMIHEYNIEKVTPLHHHVYSLLTILSYGGFDACVFVSISVSLFMC